MSHRGHLLIGGIWVAGQAVLAILAEPLGFHTDAVMVGFSFLIPAIYLVITGIGRGN